MPEINNSSQTLNVWTNRGYLVVLNQISFGLLWTVTLRAGEVTKPLRSAMSQDILCLGKSEFVLPTTSSDHIILPLFTQSISYFCGPVLPVESAKLAFLVRFGEFLTVSGCSEETLSFILIHTMGKKAVFYSVLRKINHIDKQHVFFPKIFRFVLHVWMYL